MVSYRLSNLFHGTWWCHKSFPVLYHEYMSRLLRCQFGNGRYAAFHWSKNDPDDRCSCLWIISARTRHRRDYQSSVTQHDQDSDRIRRDLLCLLQRLCWSRKLSCCYRTREYSTSRLDCRHSYITWIRARLALQLLYTIFHQPNATELG